MSRIATLKDKIPKNSILARIFGLGQGYKDKSCPGQDFRETRTRWHPCGQRNSATTVTQDRCRFDSISATKTTRSTHATQCNSKQFKQRRTTDPTQCIS